MRRIRQTWSLLAGLAALTLACGPSDSTTLPAVAANEPGKASIDRAARRDEALASARVWQPPVLPIAQANLRGNPQAPGRIDDTAEVTCRFMLRAVNGTTPKFYCELPDGEALKIKYGRENPELHAEVAASRLLTALGFPADQMFTVGRVRCAGCPMFPFQALRCSARLGLQSACFPGGIDYDRVVDFDWAVLERKLPGRVIEAFADQGWAWYELDAIDPERGGSTRAEVDAFRLLAVFLAHWDNKAANQRLVCPAGFDERRDGCSQPLAIIQDLGATFGPLKIDLPNWRRGRIWKDAKICTVSMEHLPWGGATFSERRISEDGRLMLLRLLEQLSDQQLRDLFEGSRIATHEQFGSAGRRAEAWVAAFKDRVAQIRAAGPCPS
jgi:hypothetical protein